MPPNTCMDSIGPFDDPHPFPISMPQTMPATPESPLRPPSSAETNPRWKDGEHVKFSTLPSDDEKRNHQFGADATTGRSRKSSLAEDDGYSSGGYWSSGYWSSSGECRQQQRKRRNSHMDTARAREYLKNAQRIHTAYTPLSLTVHLCQVVIRLYTLAGTPSPFAITSFTHLVYLVDTFFHVTSLLWHFFRYPKLERIWVVYGTWVVWIGWAYCLWVAEDVVPEYPTDPVAPFIKKYGRWRSSYLPVVSFWILLLFRRNLWGLISWEHMTRMDQIDQLKWYRVWCLAGVGIGWTVFWKCVRWWFRIPFLPFDDDDMCIYTTTMPCSQLPSTTRQYRSDLPHTQLVPMLASNFVMGLILLSWWSFWTFQYQAVLWRQDLTVGWAIWKTDRGVHAGKMIDTRWTLGPCGFTMNDVITDGDGGGGTSDGREAWSSSS